MFVGLSLVSVLASYFAVFFLLPAELLNREPVLAFGIPLFAGPFLVSVACFYECTNRSTIVFIGIIPAIAAAILLLLVSQSSSGIAGDGPIWLILLVVVVLGLVVSGIGSMIGIILRIIAN